MLIAFYIYIQTEGIGTVRSVAGVADFPDDALSSDEEDEDEDDLLAPTEGLTPTASVPDFGGKVKTPTSSSKSVGGLSKLFPGKRLQLPRVDTGDSLLTTDSTASTPTPSRSVTTQDVKEKKRKLRISRKARGGEYSFDPENDVLGIVMLEIRGASDLPKLSNRVYAHGYHIPP